MHKSSCTQIVVIIHPVSLVIGNFTYSYSTETEVRTTFLEQILYFMHFFLPIFRYRTKMFSNLNVCVDANVFL